ncbi:TRAP transporter small permease subunit [Sulfurospirillum sp. 1612]|uniref:TRAP transporter small permease subunit n=1 Tax=Sulfurospirillum sp. 1612 TaxID=3094835 RepID=UPI002F9435F3
MSISKMPALVSKRFSKSIKNKMLKRYFLKFDKGLNTLGVFLSSLCIIALVALILLEIVLRTFFDTSTMFADEYSGYFYLASVFLSLGFAFREKAHIRINILTSRLKNVKLKQALDIYAGVVTFFVILFILYRVILMCMDSYEFEILSEGVSATPIYMTQIPMIVGLFIFVIAILAFIIKGGHHDS